MPPPPVTLTFDLLTLKVVSESRVTWATSVPILVFLGLSVVDLGPDVHDKRQTGRRQTASSLNAPAYDKHFCLSLSVTIVTVFCCISSCHCHWYSRN